VACHRADPGHQRRAIEVNIGAALSKLARVLGVSVEELLSSDVVPERRHGPVGRMQRIFEDVSHLPRRQQDKVIEFVEAFVAQQRKAG
jgi:hypothetical protein